MKPDWKDAPEWADWLAQDRSGAWYWHEAEPVLSDGEWFSRAEVEPAMLKDSWTKTLEQRPEQ